ncbi:hypothetical protein [Sphingomonas paucimobilis]|uniref:hypothetical protein n=1 Tax=Sphingomonas paucimobilis TaxID=13689 RepID=UPI0031DB4CAE
MSYLINKRNRLRNMVAEQEADPWLVYSDDQLHDLVSDENFALMLLEIEQHYSLRLLELERRPDPARDLAQARARGFALSLGHIQDGTRHALRQMEIWEAAFIKAENEFAHHSARVREYFKDVEHQWAMLTDQERAFFGKPIPHPSTAIDFPLDINAERGLFYPERTSKQEGQLRKLREELERVEQECASLEGQ